MKSFLLAVAAVVSLTAGTGVVLSQGAPQSMVNPPIGGSWMGVGSKPFPGQFAPPERNLESEYQPSDNRG